MKRLTPKSIPPRPPDVIHTNKHHPVNHIELCLDFIGVMYKDSFVNETMNRIIENNWNSPDKQNICKQEIEMFARKLLNNTTLFRDEIETALNDIAINFTKRDTKEYVWLIKERLYSKLLHKHYSSPFVTCRLADRIMLKGTNFALAILQDNRQFYFGNLLTNSMINDILELEEMEYINKKSPRRHSMPSKFTSLDVFARSDVRLSELSLKPQSCSVSAPVLIKNSKHENLQQHTHDDEQEFLYDENDDEDDEFIDEEEFDHHDEYADIEF